MTPLAEGAQDDAAYAEAARRRHELRTPVNHILGYAELLIEDAEDLGRADRAGPLRAIHAEGKEVLQLVSSARASDDAERAELGRRLGAHLTAIHQSCDALEAADPTTDRDALAADLRKIRAACDRLVALALG